MLVERMAVEIEGEGEPVLMIHGLGGTSNTFTPVLAAFARHRTIRFDLPGSGRSHRVEGPLSLALFVDKTSPGHAAGRGRARARRRALDGHDRRDAPRRVGARQASRASRSSARCSPRPSPPARRSAPAPPRRARATCSRSPTRWCARASRRRRRAQATRGRRLRPRVADAPGSRGLRAQLRGARRDGARGHVQDRLPDAARHRRRGRGRPAAGGAHDGRADHGKPGRGAARLRALDAGREARGMHRSVEAIPSREETDMANVLFTNVRIIDATGAQPYPGEVLVQGNRIARVGRGHPQPPHHRGDGDRRRRRDPDARHVRGAHPLRLDQLQDAGRHPEDAARGAHPVGGAGGQALPRPRLDVLRRRRHAQAAARLRDPRRHQLGADPGAALPRGEPGDHGDRLARRRHAAAPAVPGDVVRLRGGRPRRHAEGRAHVPQVRRRPGEAQPVRRQPGAGRGRAHELDERRGSGGGRARGEGARQAPGLARALERVGEAEHAPRRRGDLPRELRRRGSARHDGGAEGPDLRRARPLRDHPPALRGRGGRRHERRSPSAWATSSSSRRR